MRRFLNVSECAIYLRTSESVVRDLIERGELPHVNLGEAVVIDRLDLQKWFARTKQPRVAKQGRKREWYAWVRKITGWS